MSVIYGTGRCMMNSLSAILGAVEAAGVVSIKHALVRTAERNYTVLASSGSVVSSFLRLGEIVQKRQKRVKVCTKGVGRYAFWWRRRVETSEKACKRASLPMGRDDGAPAVRRSSPR